LSHQRFFFVPRILAVICLATQQPVFGAVLSAPAAHIVASPTEAPCAEPNIARGADGLLYLSWVETPSEDSSILRVAHSVDDTAWSEQSIVARGADRFVNWADFPAIAASDSGFMLASWLQSVG
jgi:hypothetical protein